MYGKNGKCSLKMYVQNGRMIREKCRAKQHVAQPSPTAAEKQHCTFAQIQKNFIKEEVTC